MGLPKTSCYNGQCGPNTVSTVFHTLPHKNHLSALARGAVAGLLSPADLTFLERLGWSPPGAQQAGAQVRLRNVHELAAQEAIAPLALATPTPVADEPTFSPAEARRIWE